MNLSRLAVLAVFFMMVMSAFVTIPTYNVGADEHEDGGDDHGDAHAGSSGRQIATGAAMWGCGS